MLFDRILENWEVIELKSNPVHFCASNAVLCILKFLGAHGRPWELLYKAKINKCSRVVICRITSSSYVWVSALCRFIRLIIHIIDVYFHAQLSSMPTISSVESLIIMFITCVVPKCGNAAGLSVHVALAFNSWRLFSILAFLGVWLLVISYIYIHGQHIKASQGLSRESHLVT